MATIVLTRVKNPLPYGTTQKFIQVVNDITGEDLSWFFNQRVYEAGYPVLDFSVSFAN